MNCLADDNWSPAAFTDDEKSLQNLIEFPQTEKDLDIIIVCQAYIRRSGRFGSNVCFYQDDKYLQFERAIFEASRGAVIKPARKNKSGRNVLLSYRVQFIQIGNKRSIKAYPNDGMLIGEYGEDYFSPQLLYDTFNVSKACSSTPHIWIAVGVNEEGMPISSDVGGGKSFEGCRREYTRGLDRSLFVPARLNGQVITAKNILSFFNRSAIKKIRRAIYRDTTQQSFSE